MVKYSSRTLNRTFAALADPTRRHILQHLARGDRCVTHLARPHAMSLPAVSKHLRVLEKAGLLRCDCGFASGCAIERRSALKKSRNGPASAALVAVSRAKIDNQTTILRSGRFTTMTNIGRITRRMLVPLGPVAAAVSVTIPICRASVSDVG